MDGIIAHLSDTHMSKYKNNDKKQSAQANRRAETLRLQKEKKLEYINRSRKLLEFDGDEDFSSTSESESCSSSSISSDVNLEETLTNANVDNLNGNGNGNDEGGEKVKVIKNSNSLSSIEMGMDCMNYNAKVEDKKRNDISDYPERPPGQNKVFSATRRPKPILEKFKNRLMTNEWLLDRPEDLNDWLYVPCPIGNHRLVIATSGETRCYSNKGFHHINLNTILPNGNPLKTQLRHHTVLDCVLEFKTKTIYVLDVIKWKGYDYFHCTADFRHEWKESLIEDLMCDYQDPGMKENMEKMNFWKVEVLKAFNCNEFGLQDEMNDEMPFEIQNSQLSATLTSATSISDDDNDENLTKNENENLTKTEKIKPNRLPPGTTHYHTNKWKLDGVLVYHKEGMYYPCGEDEETYALYGWLKQDRMKELINSYAEFNYDPPKVDRAPYRNNKVQTGYRPKNDPTGMITSSGNDRGSDKNVYLSRKR